MYEENGRQTQKLYFSDKEAQRIEENAEAMGMSVGEYIKFAIRSYEQNQVEQ